MDAIELLMAEHRTIERVLDALDVFVVKARGQGGTPDDLRQFVTFIREYADLSHHGKEEGILFVEMVKSGFPSEGGPIAVMKSEHEMGRGFVGVMAEHARQAAWSEGDRQVVAEAAAGYSSLLRQHIEKEDELLYPMARDQLTPDAMAGVDQRCLSFQNEQQTKGNVARLEGLAADLHQRFTK
ncbi:MAG: hemerythrin domain-containing protein [Deltaproteobacteria bacterium]|nr:hemerythrin domain-containing protein [Deltaproteobacteria bacterium]